MDATAFALVPVCLAIGGLIWQGGRLSQRVDQHEKQLTDTAIDLKAIRSTTDRIDAVLQHTAGR